MKSVGRAEDCRTVNAYILRSLFQIRVEGGYFCIHVINVALTIDLFKSTQWHIIYFYSGDRFVI